MRIPAWSWGLLCSLMFPLHLAAAQLSEPPAVVSGFTDLAQGYQRLPGAGDFYVDADPEVAGGADPRWKPWNPRHLEVAKQRARGPDPGVRNATQPAYLLSLRGGRAGAEAALASARQRYPDSVGLHWSEGWIRLNLLDFEGALVAWQQAERLHGGQPFWVPYSKAIALMGLKDGEAASAWWKVAMRSYTPELDTAQAARNRFQHWRSTEKQLLEDVIRLAYDVPATVPSAVAGLQVVSMPVPHYPPQLAAAGVQGVTHVRLRVDAQGVPSDVSVERSSGYAEFDAEALRAARLARFRVAEGLSGDDAVAVVPYRFALNSAPPPAR